MEAYCLSFSLSSIKNQFFKVFCSRKQLGILKLGFILGETRNTKARAERA